MAKKIPAKDWEPETLQDFSKMSDDERTEIASFFDNFKRTNILNAIEAYSDSSNALVRVGADGKVALTVSDGGGGG